VNEDRDERTGFACVRAEDAAAFVAGEMTREERQDFDAHCRDCDECRALVRQFVEVEDVFERRPMHEPGKGLAERVVAGVREERAASRLPRVVAFPPWQVDFRWAAAAACLLALAGISALVWFTAPASRGQPPVVASQTHADQEGAVRQALDWLAGAQEKSGAWDPVRWKGQKEYEVALTGMALLTFVRQPDARVRARYSRVIASAVGYLVRQQDAGGGLGPDIDGRMYNHGIATVALIEAARVAGDERLKEASRAAVQYVAVQQLDSGGWGYRKRSGEEANTSISAWQLHALKLAQEAGLSDTLPAYRRGMRWLRGVMDGAGSFGYQRAGDKSGESDTLTAMGAFCLLADRRGAEVADIAKVRASLRGAAAGWNRETDFYRWYFLVSALRASGDAELRGALEPVCRSLLTTRNREGTHGGTWEPVGAWSSVGGRIYTTAMATLCLEGDNG
jgi:hypothetical protein